MQQLVEASVLDEEIASLSRKARGGFVYLEGTGLWDSFGENITHVWAEVFFFFFFF